MNEPFVKFKAPWGGLLKGMSLFVVVLLVGIALVGFFDGAPGLLVLYPLILSLAVPFMVRGYAIEGGELVVQRPFWTTRFSLAELVSAEVSPTAMKRCIRLFGNGGLFSFTGLYRNKELGTFRAFVNDFNRTVVLKFTSRTIVVSPERPQAFVDAIKEQAGK